MTKRQLLRDDLNCAWRSVIKNFYDAQQIDSEASLQAYFAATLINRFEKAKRKSWRIFLEPTIKLPPSSIHRKPDLLICNNNQIIGVVELKYAPRGEGNEIYEKDLKTLLILSENRQHFQIANERYLGPLKSVKSYSLAKDAVLCWAGVYSGPRLSTQKFKEAGARDDFLALHAITSPDNPATI